MRGDRREPYKEDSTKGGSVINPLNYKGDVLVQVWIDSRVLATLCEWLDSKGTYTRYMSQVVRRPLEILVDLLVNTGDVDLIDNTVEARSLLQRRFGVDLSRGGRGTKNVMHNVELSIRREDLAESINRENRVYDVRRPLRGQQDPKITTLVEQARKKMKELYPDGKETMEGYEPFQSTSEDYDDTKPIIRGTEDKVLNNKDPEPLKLNTSYEVTHERMRRLEEEDKKQAAAIASFDPMSLLSSAKKE